jgi:hypothetical protein
MTVKKGQILKELKKINQLFNDPGNSSDIEKQRLFSKLALLEFCGWIELTMDSIVEDYAKKRLKDKKNFDEFKKNKIDRTYGFDYEKHFRSMLIHLIGICNIELMEKDMNQQVKALFESTLKLLWPNRSSHAHTHIQGTNASFDAPSITIKRLDNIYGGLKEIEKQLKRIK